MDFLGEKHRTADVEQIAMVMGAGLTEYFNIGQFRRLQDLTETLTQ